MDDFDKDLAAALEVLRKGGIILYPTDTIWGIGCDATNPEAVERIYRLKQRSDQHAMIVLTAEERDVLQYVAAPDMELFDYLAQCQKPTTVIYEGALGLAGNLLGQDGSVGIRICKDSFCRHLLKRFRRPLVSTSANISGQQSPANFQAISAYIKKGVDYIVKWRQEEKKEAKASSIIRWNQGKVEIIRP
ncbi:MAG: L-threonylcarbamoyladenylate synthase [Chitinophagaceae bacterium]